MTRLNLSRKTHLLRISAILCLLWSYFWIAPSQVHALPVGFQEYYVLGYEEHIWRAFEAITGSSISSRICSTVSLVATADYQVVYYDHWEDGYETDDLLSPGHQPQSTTEVYGDGVLGNGGTGSDILRAGDDINLTSNENNNTINGYVPVNPRDPSQFRYDGSDRVITSGGPVALTHAMWPLNTTWAGGAWEVYSRQSYAGYSYRLPIGEDLYTFGGGDTGTYGDLRDVFLQLEAFEDTWVLIDNGTDRLILPLERGETYSSMGYINSRSASAITINAGTTIRSSEPVQVGLVTGADRDSAGNGFQGRFLIILPDHLWGADYVVPVPSGNNGDEAEVYLSNPNDFPITINAYDAETQTTFAISPTAYVSATVPYSEKRGGLGYVPRDSAARFTSSDGVFGVVVCADTSDVNYDWGFSGIPSKYLTRNYYISWAPGDENIPPQNNGSPVWVTPLADGTTFYVDYSPADGDVDKSFPLDVLEQQRIFDPDDDNTGMHVWANGEFAVVWGEDPRTAGDSDPYLDLGIAMLPQQEEWLDSVLTLDKTAEPTILPSAGGVVTFTLVAQTHNKPLVNVDITDTLPINWTYVAGSTRVTYPDGSTPDPDPTPIDSRTLFWDLSTGLDINQTLTLTFQAQLTDTGSVGTTIYDGFESGDYFGGENWAGDWQEGGDDGNPTGGDVVITTNDPFASSYHLRIRDRRNEISRAVDLTSFTLPILRFVKNHQVSHNNEHFYLDIYDGASWTNGLLDWANGSQEGTYVQEVVDLTPYASAATAIRFRSSGNVEDADYLYVDEVEIYEAGVNVNQGEAIGKHEYSDKLFNAKDEATIYISPLSLVKSVSSAQAEIGDTLVYTLSYVNHSSSITATNVVLRDPVPIQHVTFQSASGGGDYDGASSTITWALGTLAPGDSGTVTFTVKVNDFVRDGTSIENIGYVSSDQTVEAGSNAARTDVLAPDVEFTNVGPTVAARGQVITYTLSYENVGRIQATEATIQDIIPISTTYVAGSLAINTGSGWVALTDANDADQGAFISPTLVIIPGVTPGAIAPGEAGQIRFSVRLGDALPHGSLILNWATLDRKLDIPRDSNLMVTRIYDLLIQKAAEQAVVAPGGVISYSLTYTNSSEIVGQTNVYVREPIPDHTGFITGTAYGGDQIEYSWDNGLTWSTTLPVTPATHIRWYDANLPTSTQETVGFAVQVKDPLLEGTTIQNMAHISSTQTSEYIREWIPSNRVEVATVDLWVGKSVSQNTVRAGDPISYTISYGNHGSVDAVGVQIVDTVPTGTNYIPGTIWGTGADVSGNPILVWDVMTVPAGASAQQVGYAVVVDAGLAPGVVTNTATVSSTYEVETSSPVTTTVTTEADLTVVKLDNPDPVAAGMTLTYTLVYTNNGLSNAQNVYITDTLPVSVSFGGVVSEAPLLPSFNQDGQHLTWYTPTLAAYASGTIVLTVTVNPDASGIITNTATVSSTYEVETSNPVTTTVTTEADLTVVKLDNPDPVAAGMTLTYTLVYTNNGPSDAQNVYITDTLPVSVGFGGVVSEAPLLPSFNQDGQYLTWYTPTLAADASGTIVLTVTVNPDASDIITNNVVITSSTLDTDPDNNEDNEPTAVGACICLLPDLYEEDDVAGQAVGLNMGELQRHRFCDDATDWITFTAQADYIYTITTSSWGQRADTFLALFDTDARTLLAANDDYEGATDYSSRIVWQAPADGVYYVRTTNRAGLTGCLTDYELISVQRAPEQVLIYLPIVMRNYDAGGGTSGNDVYPMGIISHTCPDDYETDDTWQQAHVIEADDVQIHSFDSDPQRYAADKDFVWFDVSAGRTITFTVTSITNTQTLLDLYDVHGAALNVTGTTQLVWIPATTGRYYLSVSPLTTTFGCTDAVGYDLFLMEMPAPAPEGPIYLPIIMRNYH